MEGLEGVRFLDHTADVGIDVEAPSMEALFHRAALGMIALLRGHDDPSPHDAPSPHGSPAAGPGPAAAAREDVLSASGRGRDAVLAGWLKEVLYLHESGWDYREADFDRLDDAGIRATVRSEPGHRAVREIKGVTYHELAVERTAGGWRGRVIFDV